MRHPLSPTPKASDLPDAIHRRNSHGTYYLPGTVARLPEPSKLLPTPRASVGPIGGPNQRGSGGDYALPGAVVNLLPTPTARDWKSGASNLHGTNSRPLNEVVLLFKTPTANLGTNGAAQHPDKRKAGGHGPTLDDEVSYLLPLPSLEEAELVQDWAEYEPAIRRQEALSGREAPIPTEIGPKGGRRLAVRFAEWLMWLPDGWVTAVPGLSRAMKLHKIGNGVVPAQAYEAFRYLLTLDTHEKEN